MKNGLNQSYLLSLIETNIIEATTNMFRALGKSKIAFVLAILFGISLFFFRSSSRYSNFFNSDNVIATVSGTPISTTIFNRSMQMKIDQFSQFYDNELSKDAIKFFQMESLSGLINNAVFENEFEKNKFLIDETVVAKKTKQRFPELYNDDNKINELALNTFLNQNGLKIDDLVNIIELETKGEVFDNLFFKINMPNKIIEKINKHENHKRQVEYIKLDLNILNVNNIQNKNFSKENKDIISYYNQNIDKYMSEETRDISYIIIDEENYIEQFTPSEISIQKYYQENKKIYLEPEKREFIQFNFKSKNEADDFLNKIKTLNQDDILNFANENKIIFTEFKDLSKNEVLEELSNEIFKLNIGEISNVIETTLANHIIILKKIIPKKQQTYKESFKTIKDTLLTVELNSFLSELKENISKKILDGSSINEIANTNNFEIKYLKNVDKFHQNNEKNLIEDEIIRKAFASNIDFVSDLAVYNDQKSFIFNVDNVYPSKPKGYEIIYEKIIKDWIFSKKKDFIEDDFINNLKNHNYLEKLSSTYFEKVQIIEIKKNNSDLPIKLINKIFEKKEKEKILHFEEEQVYVAEITNIIMPKETNYSEKYISLSSNLKNAFGSEIIKNKKISTNDGLLNALLSQY